MSEEGTAVERAARARKIRRLVLIIGMVAGLICKSLPPDYQEACKVIFSVCTGGF